jgi:PmbA protein
MSSGLRLLDVARAALVSGRRLGVDLEVYVQRARTVQIKTFKGEVELESVAEPRGLGVRAIRDGRVGYAFTADLSISGSERALREAAANLEVADPDSFSALPDPPSFPYPALPGLWRAGVGTTPLDQKIKIALQAEAAALAVPDVVMVEASVYSDEEVWTAVASTRGIEVEAEESFCFAYVEVLAGRDEERQTGFGYTTGREPGELQPEKAGEEGAVKARALLGAQPCATGNYTVVFDREVAAALIGSIAQALSAESVQKGRSVFAGRLGDAVGSRLLTIWDDGLALDGMSTSPFDGEGMPQQTTTLVEAGVLRSFLHNSYTARKDSATGYSTGNGVRGSYRTLPGVGATNLIVSPGAGSLEDLCRRVGNGLYVQSVAGLHSGVNPISGEISVGVTGCLIEAGRLSRPVREVTIATDFTGLLGSVSDIGGDERWVPLRGSVKTPSFAARDIAVSGT